MELLPRILLAWLAADFITGLIHWIEDTYGSENWPRPILEAIVLPNVLHHKTPSAMLHGSYWDRVALSVYAASALAVLAFACGALTPLLALTLAFASQSNQVHYFSHLGSHRPKWVRVLQDVGIFQRPRTHGVHHTAPFSTHFCVMSEFMNPLLERIQFFPSLEYILARAGISAVRGADSRTALESLV